MLEIYEGSIFDTDADAYVNTINCIGIMGAGIAKVFKERYPVMFEDYQQVCSRNEIKPGDIYTYDHEGIYLLGAAVKNDWKHFSTHEWIVLCLKNLKKKIKELGIKTINMPLFGSKNGHKGPLGPVDNMLLPPDAIGILKLTMVELKDFAEKEQITIRLYLRK